MSVKVGALLWNRMRITLAAATSQAASTLEVDTGITQLSKTFKADSSTEPTLGSSAASIASLPLNPLVSRVQVIPLAPTPAWAGVTHEEPYFNTTTGTVHVVFSNSAQSEEEINVLFWDPHTLVGPGDADTYNS